MEDKLEIVYYQLVALENRLDKKLEYIEKSEKTIEKAAMQLDSLLKKIEKMQEK